MNLEEFVEQAVPVIRDAGAQRAYLFGSHARGSADPHSDIDLLIVDDEDLPYLRRLDKYFDALSALARRGIDLLVIRPSELADRRELPFYRHILKDARLIYER